MLIFDPVKTQKALGAVRKLPPDLRAKAYIIGAIRAAIYTCSFILAPLLYLSLRDGSPTAAVCAITTVLFVALQIPLFFRVMPTWSETFFFLAAAILTVTALKIWVVCAINIGIGILSIFVCKRCFKFIADEYERRDKGGSK